MKKIFLFVFAVLFWALNSAATTYCTPGFGDPSNSCFSYNIDVSGFSVTGESGTSISDYTGCTGSGYEDLHGSMSVTFAVGGSYVVSFTGSLYNSDNAQLWIDFNNDGVFDASETVGGANGFGYTTTFTASIPAGVSPGTYRMRVLTCWSGCCGGSYPTMDPCASGYAYGDAHDYTVTIIPPPPTVTTAPTSLAFGGVTVGTSSATQTFTLNGSYLLPASGTITVTAPPNFQVSSDGVSWTGTYDISYTGSTVPATTVYVQFNPTAYISYSDNVTITGGGLSSTYNEPVTGTGATACTGTPTAGTATVSPAYGNTSTAFALSLSGYTIAGGITYQWQSSPDGVTYTDISGATLAGYSFTGISSSTYFQCVETCPTYSTSTSTSTLAVYVPSPTCLPTSSSWSGETGSVGYGVDGFNITGYSGSTLSDAGITTAADPSTGYVDRTSMTPVNLQQTVVYPSSATFGFLSYAQELQVWIDFNDDGVFDPSEEVSPVSGYSTSSTPNPVLFNITIPATAPVGEHLMRIRGIWETFAYGLSLSTDLDPCLIDFAGGFPYYYSGTVADYRVNILTAPPTVTAAPTSLAFGGVTVGTSSATQTFTLNGSYLTPASGSLTVTAPPNFQVSSDGVSWTGSYSISYTGGTIPATTVYVQFNPTAYISYSDNVTITGGGLTSAYNEPVTGTGAAPCSGTPTPGTAIVAPTYGNTTTAFALSLSGYTIAGGITYQWQSSPDGVTYTDIAGATLAGYSFTGISASTYYQCVETCPTYSTATSTSALATYIPPPTCLPISSSWSGESGNAAYGVDGFNISGYSGSTLSDAGITTVADPSTGYADRTSITPVNLQQSGVYSSSATFGITNSAQELQVWIDFNDDGTFDPSEEVSPVSGYSPVFTSSPVFFNITIPITAPAGNHLMRIRGIWETFAYGISLSTDLDPCLIDFAGGFPYYYSGTVADYIVNIVPLPACTGTPTAGTVSATTSTGCAPYTSNLSLVGSSTGVAGLTYQWQTSTDCSTWTPVAGATNATYTASVSATVDYNCVVTCTTSGLSATTPCYPLILNTPPAAITGTASACVGNTSTLSDATAGGTWSSSDVTIATVDPTLGTVTAVGSGIVNIIYTIPSGCTATASFVSDPIPSTVTITPGTSATLCSGDSMAFSASATVASLTILSEDFNSGLDGWAVVNTGAASIYNWAVVAPGSLSDISYVTGDGSNYAAVDGDLAGTVTLITSLISPSFSTMGYSAASLSYNEFYSPYSGDNNVEVDYSTDGGATWNLVLNELGIGDYSSSWTPGFPNQTVSLPAGALGQPNVMLRWYYNSFFGNQWVIDNVVISTTGSLSYTWGGTGGATGLSCTACTTTTITPASTGDNVYTVIATSAGCSSSASTITISVNPSPAAITGTLNACVGGTTTLNDATGSGTWSSSDVTIATIDPTTGLVTAASTGTTTITYMVATGCIATATFIVNSAPGAITGSFNACTGLTTTLSDPGGVGNWTSSDITIATVGSTSGIVTGVASGTVNISYSNSCGLPVGATITVNTTPAPITGPAIICMGLTATLSDAIAGGTWSSSDPTIASIDPVTGIVTSVSTGNVTINYTLADGCPDATASEAINPSPVLIASVSPTSICFGGSSVGSASATMSDVTILSEDFNSGLGSWTVINTGTASPYNWAITAPGSLSDNTSLIGDGSNFMASDPDLAGGSATLITSLISPSFSTVGFSAGTLAYNEFYQSYSADYNVEVDYSIDGGTTWTTIVNQLGISDYNYTWTVGSPNIIAALPAGALGHPNVILRWYYNSNYGWQWAVDNIVVSGTPNISYAWSGIGGATGLSCTTCTSPTVTPTATGVNSYSITATSIGCTSSATVAVTVNPLPAAISGTLTVCSGLTTALSDATGGGTWSSSNTAIATVASAGVVTGVGASGTATITYTLSTGCIMTAVVTVNPLPAVISGTLSVCSGLTTTLSDATGGGTWSSSNTAIATVGSTGVVAGIAASGTATITYTLSTGCIMTAVVTVNPLPAAISGTLSVCSGLTTTLSDAAGSGTWSSSNPAIGSVNSSTGVVTGVAASGTATITYTLSTGCIITAVVTVNPLPVAISGTLSVCSGLTISLSDATGGGTWSSSNTAIATIASTGVVTGAGASGTATITYTLPTGCIVTAAITVNPLPAAISGTLSVCSGLTTTLSDVTGGGTWSSSNTAIATVASTGVVTGAGASGTATITYTLPTGCIMTAVVTVNPLPVAISGTLSVCSGLTTTLTDATGSGTWSSSNAAIASVASTGVVTGVAASGTAIITYTLVTGCIMTAVVTVNPLPAAISGSLGVCLGLTTSLSDATGGGTWSNSDVTVATIGSSSGLVSSETVGTTTITYTLATGCITTAVLTVNPLPATITGTLTVCIGLTTTLSDATSGGTWSSGSVGIATIDPVTGVVTGISSGIAAITYTLATGCIATTNVIVNPLPAGITGTLTVCVGLTTTLTDGSAGGSWSSSNIAVATVGSGSGVVTGVLAGTATITYTLPTGCIAITTVTVNALPGIINGTLSVCQGLTTSLSDATGGGTWSSGSTGIATIDPVTGMVTGVSAGTAGVTYTLPTGCIAIAVVTVNPFAAITGTMSVCVGLTTTLSNAVTGGTWSSGTAAVGTVDPVTGIVTGLSAGTAVISYALSTGCTATAVVTVNPLPGVITGTMTVCQGSTTALTDASAGGTWSSSTTAVATVVAGTGIVTGVAAGTATITYTLPTGCIATTVTTVYPVSAITGTPTVCVGLTTTLTYGIGGTWSSSNTAVATVSPSGIITAAVTGISAGTATISYILPTGCYATMTVTVNPNPGPINGTLTVCQGLTTTLSDGSAGGTWSSSTTSVAVVGVSTGVVTGGSAGTSTITYAFPTGCIATAVVTVNPLPAVITGTLRVCAGLTTTLSDATTGGTWSSSGGIAIGSSTGVVTGVTAGTAIVTYTLPTGCIMTAVVTVNPLPAAITGTLKVCSGLTTTLSDATAGGTWSSSNAAIASIASTGIVTGVAASGTAIITYTLPTGCIMTAVVTVNPLPSVITGTLVVCSGLTTTLSDGTAGGTWGSGLPSVASVGATTGIVTGGLVVVASTATIIYTLPTGCIATAVVSVNPLPAAITGTLSVCAGLTTTVSDLTAGGTWSSGSTSVATIASTGIVTGVLAGTSTITYMLPTGCIMTAVVTVNPLPAAITGTLSVCTGLTTTLTDAAAGGTWTSSTTTVATIDPVTGVVTGVLAGTSTFTYMLSTGCIITAVATVNPLPTAIMGTLSVCAGLTTTLVDTTAGGTWSSGTTGIATVGSSSGIVTGVLAGTSTITYTLPTGCIATAVVTVKPLPGGITGTSVVCQGSTTALADTSAGGTWSSGAPGIATVGSGSGIVTGVAGGSAIITYTLPTGCITTDTVMVNPLPAAITGAMNVCNGSTTTLNDATSGGTWSSSNTAIATVGSGTGVVSGASVGTATITYALPTGCNVTALVVVNPMPSAITGTMVLCAGTITTLNNSVAGGAWSSSDTTIADVSSTGIVTGMAGGTANITYTLPGGCSVTATVTINITPAVISGTTMAVCVGSGITLTDATAGGSWSSASITIASASSASGVVTGLLAGTAVIAYTLPTGCIATTEITVNPLPSIITGIDTVCRGSTTTLMDSVSGGIWSSSDTSFATINPSTGVVSGVDSGVVIITYTLPTGCMATMSVSVDVCNTGVKPIVFTGMDVRIFPNPNTGTFTINGTLGSINDQELTAEITDMLGQVVYKGKIIAKNGKIDERVQLSNTLANGMYVLNLSSGTEYRVFHFVIEE